MLGMTSSNVQEFILPDNLYKGMANKQAAELKKWTESLRKSQSNVISQLLAKGHGAAATLRLPPPNVADPEAYFAKRFADYTAAKQAAKHSLWEVMKAASRMKKAGVTSQIGFNFYDLRGPVQLLFPVNTPFRNMTTREPQVNAGVGTLAHWQRTTSPGYAYAGVPEAQRAQITTPNMVPAYAAYKEFGTEGQVTYTAEFAGEGFNDNLATERLSTLLTLFLAEEGQILNGNSGTGQVSNGYQLGTGPTPTAVLTTATSSIPSTIPTGTDITLWCVALTAMGSPQNPQYGYYNAPLTVAGGLTPTFTYNSPGTGNAVTITGGTSALSAVSNTVVTTGTDTQYVAASVTPKKGAFGGYAWFVSSNATPTTANAYLYAITPYPSVNITSVPAVTQTAAAFVAAGGNVDQSANPLDFDGLLAWAVTYGQYSDLQGGTLTPEGNGRVAQVEAMLQSLYNVFQAGVDEIWGDVIGVTCLEQAVLYGGTSATGYQFIMQRDMQNNILAGYVVSAYQSRYAVGNPLGGRQIPIRLHPMLPPGTLLFNIRTIPDGYGNSRLKFIYGLLLQRDYYGIEWPPTGRQFNFGTYIHETLAHQFPGLLGVITGIGPFQAP